MSVLTESELARFWAKVDRRGDNECWPWIGYCSTTHGYGVFVRGRQLARAHRIACALAHGPRDDMQALHSCDNRPCCNPAHLRWGTHADNMLDRQERSGYAQGERHHMARLTDDDVLEMRRIYDAGGVVPRELAMQFAIGRRTAHDIVTRRTWRHLP